MKEMSLMQKVKQERTLPVSARIDLLNLARLDLYYSTQGIPIKTMSQLVNWGIDLVCEVLEANDVMPKGKINTLADAINYLRSRGMMQMGTAKYSDRVQQKISTALRFETIRSKGGHPEDIDPRGYGELHRKSSVTPPPENTVQRQSVEEIVADAQQAAKDSGMIVGDEWVDKSKERDEKIAEEENAPIDTSSMKFADE